MDMNDKTTQHMLDYLSGKLTETEKLQFDEVLSNDPQLREECEKLKALKGKLKTLNAYRHKSDLQFIDATLAAYEHQTEHTSSSNLIPFPHHKIKKWRAALIAIAAAFVLMIGYNQMYVSPYSIATSEFSTATDSRGDILTADYTPTAVQEDLHRFNQALLKELNKQYRQTQGISGFFNRAEQATLNIYLHETKENKLSLSIQLTLLNGPDTSPIHWDMFYNTPSELMANAPGIAESIVQETTN